MARAADVRADAHTAVRRAIEDAIEGSGEIGIQVAAYLDGELVVDCWGGHTAAGAGTLVDAETLFPVFSVVKPVTAVALHVQAERGLIDYESPVARYWPEYARHGKERTTVRDVLTHRACVPQMPPDVTPERMCDWEWMTARIAELAPLAPPGSKTMYLSMTFGWIIGELVRRTDRAQRSLGTFVREEIAQPLGITDLWIGLPDSVRPRVATLTDSVIPPPADKLPPLYLASMPPQVGLVPRVFERADVRRAEIPSVGGIFTARSCARFWALLAQGGELDGVRLLSRERVASFWTQRANSDEADPVMFGRALPLTIGGFWRGGGSPPFCSASNDSICHPGAGNSLAWAERDSRLAVALLHNRMTRVSSCAEDPFVPIARAIRSGLRLQ